MTPSKVPAEDGQHLVTAPREAASLVTSQAGLDHLIARLDPTAPVAVDAERAQSFRYSSRAYLIQLRQAGCGTHLLDPIALAGDAKMADLNSLGTALAGCEWVLHAASQDLPCLAEVGMIPNRIFDTELAGRLLALPKVSISPMLSQFLGVELAKEHSADDWSRRPLPKDLLAYAALDVDYLLELRDAVGDALVASGKLEWANQEFADALARFAVVPVLDPERWRHIKGMSHLRQPRQLGVARSLWRVRDDIARNFDIAPGRILSDLNLTDAAQALSLVKPSRVVERLETLDGFGGRFAKRHRLTWADAIKEALELRPSQLPQVERLRDTPPPRFWPQQHPSAARRWDLARPAVIAIAEKHQLPPENLMTVATLASLMFPDDADNSEAGLRRSMTEVQVRPWQQDLIAPELARVLC